MAENLENLETVEETVASVAETSKKFNGKALAIGLAVAGTCGLVLLGIKLVKKAKAKKAAKAAGEAVPEPVKADEEAPAEEA